MAFLLGILPSSKDNGSGKKASAKLSRYSKIFDACVDAWLHIDAKGEGVLVLDGVEEVIKASKAPPLVTEAKLRLLDEKKTGFVGFAHFLTGFLHWIDPDDGEM